MISWSYYNDVLIQILTVGIPRYNKNYDFEILRVCSKLEHNVVGGFSKLFKYFINKYNNPCVITYANRRYGTGAVYLKSGFEYINSTPPSYFYSNGKNFLSRYQTQRHKLQNEDTSLTELDIMTIKGYYRIYDCGNNVYVYNANVNKMR